MDLAAKTATLLPKITDCSPLPAYDLKNHYRSLILASWHNLWTNQQNNKLKTIKKEPTSWSSSNRDSRHEEVILTRLRIGHTRLTHSHPILGLYAPPSAITVTRKIFQLNTSSPVLHSKTSAPHLTYPPPQPLPSATILKL